MVGVDFRSRDSSIRAACCKLPDMSEDEQLQLLATNGMLVKRPLAVDKEFVLPGFKEKEWTEKML